MTTKKSTTQKQPAKQTTQKEELKEVLVEKNKDAVLPQEDIAIQNAKKFPDPVPEPMDDSKESHEKIKQHEEIAEKVVEGEFSVPADNVANSKAQIVKPLVPEPLSGRPVYETASDYNKAQAVKGNK